MPKRCVPGSFLPAHAQEPGNEAKEVDVSALNCGHIVPNIRVLSGNGGETWGSEERNERGVFPVHHIACGYLGQLSAFTVFMYWGVEKIPFLTSRWWRLSSLVPRPHSRELATEYEIHSCSCLDIKGDHRMVEERSLCGCRQDGLSSMNKDRCDGQWQVAGLRGICGQLCILFCFVSTAGNGSDCVW